jgi:hypothetical protein
MNQLFRNGEEMYYLQLEGHLDPRVWRGWEAVIPWNSGFLAVTLALVQ